MLKRIYTNPFFIFPLITCLFFWPLSLQLYALKNDALTYYYPIRTLISDALNNGELPLWTPFINMGYPMHADMQSGAWNPVIWLFSFITNYSLAAFQYELLFYISFAGIGFYFLCKDFGYSKWVAFAMAIAYQFCGFITDSVQFFTCISAACYLPFIFLFFRRLVINPQQKDAIALALFMSLSFSGGYPSIFIITCYILFAYTIFYAFNTGNKKIWAKSFLPIATLAALFFILLSLPAILSFIQHLPAIKRGESQSLSTVLENSMNPTTTLSLLTPFGTTANESWLDSSILMRNIFIGIVPLLFLMYAFFNKHVIKNKEVKFFFFCAIIMLGLAWGSFFFLRQLAYHTLPLMDSFRHPALFRLFTVFFFLLIAAASLNSWESNRPANLPALKNIILSLTGITSIMAVVCLFLLNDFSFSEFKNINLKNLLANLNFQERYLIQFPFIFSSLLLGYWAIIIRKRTQLICFVIITDLFFVTQLNMPVTVFGAKSFREVEKLINRNPVDFPLPDTSSIEQNSLNSKDENVITGSKIPFIKKIGRNDYFITPGNLALQDKFYSSPVKDIVFKNSVLYFADNIRLYKSLANITTPKIAFTDNPGLLKNTSEANTSNAVQIESLSANKMEATVLTQSDGLLIFQQNNYPGWKAFVDEEHTDILPVNISFMAIKVPAGSHVVTFKYRPQNIIYAWYISIFVALLFLVIYCYLIFSRYQPGKRQKETVQP